MAQTRRASASPAEGAFAEYLAASRRPLHILLFLLPLILAYELGLALLLRLDVKAHKGLLEFFAALGVPPTGGLYLGGLVIIIILLAWHLLLNDRWRVHPTVLAMMALEAVVLSIPLLVLRTSLSAPGAGELAAAGAVSIDELNRWSRLAISIGAGLYEELLFRWVLIAVVHTLLVDLGKLPEWLGASVAVLVSAASFTWYHDLSGASSQAVLFVFLAGVYLAVVFTLRGFGIVVGVHALYNASVALLG